MRALNPTARDLRRINRRTILQAIHAENSISRLELGQRTGLSIGTVTNVVAELLLEGIVLESGFEASEGGRRRAILTLNLQYGYLLGGEIGETDVIVELFDLTLKKIGEIRQSLEHGEPSQVIEYVVSGVKSLLTSSRIAPEKILGLGLGVPGIIEYTESGEVAAPAWNWAPVPLKAMLREHFAFPLHVENGSKMMAVAEMWSRSGPPPENMAVVNIGTGVSVGIISQGKLYRGATNSAGEWGHTVVVLDGRPCRCGRRGCLEAYIGAPGIIQRLREIDHDSPFLQPGDEIQTLSLLIAAARQGNDLARQIMRETFRYLGAGIANLVNLFNPQRIVLGGWLGLLIGEYMLPELQQIIAQYSLPQPLKAAHLVISQLKRDSVSMGAASLVLENFFVNVGALNTSTWPTPAQ